MNKLNITLLEAVSLEGSQCIEISIKTNSGLHSLFKGKVELSPFTEWFIEHKNEIINAELPIDDLTDDSLARKVHRFYDNVDIDDEKAIDDMFEYRASHCLRFASRGTNFPDIYIGKSDIGHEISIFTQNNHWRYFFDIDDFFYKLGC